MSDNGNGQPHETHLSDQDLKKKLNNIFFCDRPFINICMQTMVKIELIKCLSFLSEDKGENMEPHGVSKINIVAQNGSNVSAPVILNSKVTGNINISNNYFPGEWKCFSIG